MPFASSDGAEIYYEVHGSGPAVLFVHGSGGHHAAWYQQVPYLTGRGYSVLTLDLRGFGRSTSEVDEYDSLEFPADILAVLDAAGIDEAVLVGQSIGAAAALKVAVAHPERAAGVVLAHSLGGLDHPELAALVRADRAEAEKLPVIDRLMSRRFQQDEPEKTFLFRQLGTFNRATMQDLRNLTAGGPTLATLQDLDVPICFLAGEQDAVIRPATIQRAHELLDGSVLELVANAPHSMYWEAPALFNAAIARFLATVYAVKEPA